MLSQAAAELDPSGERGSRWLAVSARPRWPGNLCSQSSALGEVVLVNAGIFKPTPFLNTVRRISTPTSTPRGTFRRQPFRQCSSEVELHRQLRLVVGQTMGSTPSSAYSAAMAGRHALTRCNLLKTTCVNAVARAVVETPIYGTS